jgi:hypothetical protein
LAAGGGSKSSSIAFAPADDTSASLVVFTAGDGAQSSVALTPGHGFKSPQVALTDRSPSEPLRIALIMADDAQSVSVALAPENSPMAAGDASDGSGRCFRWQREMLPSIRR